jgi:hypothetical protein
MGECRAQCRRVRALRDAAVLRDPQALLLKTYRATGGEIASDIIRQLADTVFY